LCGSRGLGGAPDSGPAGALDLLSDGWTKVGFGGEKRESGSAEGLDMLSDLGLRSVTSLKRQ
jgi:hypothetical protein